MVAIRDVGWGAFGGFEGPRYIGHKKVALPANASFDEKVMYVTSASEGNYDSINMYDRAIISCGAIQWIELGQYSVSDMIGHIAEKCGEEFVNAKLSPGLTMSKATFKKTPKGRWRFHVLDPNGKEVPVDTEALSRYMFCKSSGKMGTWTEINKLWAKAWAACIAELFETDEAVAAQVEWTVPQLRARFVLSQGKAIVFSEGSSYEGYAGALKALLIAYGVNLPAIAEKTIAAAAARSTFPRWSKQWCLDLMHDLALTSGVAIWPGRYDLKRPSLERAFGIELPKNQIELSRRAWAKQPVEMIPLPVAVVETPVERPHVEIPMPAAETVVARPERPIRQAPRGFLDSLRGFSDSILKKLKS